MWFFLSFFPAKLIVGLRGLEEAKNPAGKSPPPDSRSALVTPSLAGISLTCQTNSPQPRTAGFKFNKRSQLFICPDDEALSVVAVRVNNPNRSPVGFDR
jgi:hypothetical protein